MTAESEMILGYAVSRRGLAGDVALAAGWCGLDDGSTRYAAFVNPHSLVVSKADGVFRAALHEADLLCPDGAGMLLAAKLLGGDFPERVAGTELFLGLSEHANRVGGFSYFFLGSSEDVLEKIRLRLAHDFPNITFAGSYSPPFKAEFSAEEQVEMVAAVNEASPTVLWVGMTAPKQEKWIHSNRTSLKVPFAGAIGAVFEFYAGTTKRAPAWARRIGLEWLIRLLREPRRLWRRNLVSAPVFLVDVFKAAVLQRFGR